MSNLKYNIVTGDTIKSYINKGLGRLEIKKVLNTSDRLISNVCDKEMKVLLIHNSYILRGFKISKSTIGRFKGLSYENIHGPEKAKELREKRSIFMKRPKSLEQIKNMSLARKNKYKGKDNPNWKGGLTPVSISLRMCDEYKKWRQDVMKRDNFTCQDCGKENCFLEVHHKIRFIDIIRMYYINNKNDGLNCRPLWYNSNGVTLCKDCHNIYPKNGKEAA